MFFFLLFVVFSGVPIVPFNGLEGTHSNAGEGSRAGKATMQGLLYANVSQTKTEQFISN